MQKNENISLALRAQMQVLQGTKQSSASTIVLSEIFPYKPLDPAQRRVPSLKEIAMQSNLVLHI